MAEMYVKCTLEDHRKHEIYPTNLSHLHLEGSPKLSTSPHQKRFTLIDREFYGPARAIWMIVIEDHMRKLQGFEFVHRPYGGTFRG